MPRVKANEILKKIDYDKCLSKSDEFALRKGSAFGFNTSRSDLRGGCDTKNNKKNIFKDFARSLNKIQKEKLDQEGEILTNKLYGTTTKSRKEEDQMDDEVQSGSGKKRKHHNSYDQKQHNIKKKKKKKKK